MGDWWEEGRWLVLSRQRERQQEVLSKEFSNVKTLKEVQCG